MSMFTKLLDPALIGDIWFGPQASSFAHRVDALYNFLVWISAFFFAVIVVGTIWLAWKYRFRQGHEPQPSPSHNTKIEIVWSVIPGLLCAAIFWYGFEVYLDLKTVPGNAYTIDVEAKKWGWNMTHTLGDKTAAGVNEIHTWAGQPTRLNLTSQDVLHSLWVPDFRIKQDCVPGRFTETWFVADKPGKHPLLCTEYCGTGHSYMKTQVVVHATKAEYEAWLKVESDVTIGRSPEEAGELLYTRNCKTCHGNAPGANLASAPNFYGIKFGQSRPLADGSTVTWDENYIKNSILYPGSQLVAGYPQGGMPSFQGQLSDAYIAAITAYIRKINSGN